MLVTAGGTREPIDAVRIITNRSSGKQGYAIAEVAARRGADVTLVTTIGRPAPSGVEIVAVQTAAEMQDAVIGRAPAADVIVMAAAVADFRPKEPPNRKLKKHEGIPEIVLEPTHDFLVDLGRDKLAGQVLVGFAAETDDLVEHAAEKLRTKRLDLIVGNDISQPDAGFEVDTNRAVILDADGGREALPLLAKSDLAGVILDKVARLLDHKKGSMSHFTFTSESVTEGHPDKMSDQISDGVLDAIFEQDPQSRVACETLCTTGLIVVAGEISTQANIDYQRTVRDTVRGIGYSSSAFGFDANTCAVITSIDEQSPDIAMGVDKAKEIRDGLTDHYDEVGAGDQGMMFGYACDDTDDLMPMPIWLAHRLARRLTAVRKEGILDYLRPDGKTQVSIVYEDGKPKALTTVLISSQHGPGIDIDGQMRNDLIEHVIKPTVPDVFAGDDYEVLVNPTGAFELGGPARRLRSHRAQDHRRHLRRHGPSRRRRVQRQGPDQGRPLGRVRGAPRGQERRRRGHRHALRGAGRVRDRCRAPGVGDGGDVRHVRDRPRQAPRPGARRSSTSVPPRSSSASTCAGRSTSRPRRTGTSDAATATSRGSAPTTPTRCKKAAESLA